jgi:hypothetical protein
MNQLFSDHSVTSTRTPGIRVPLLPLCLSWAEHMTEMKGADKFCKVPIILPVASLHHQEESMNRSHRLAPCSVPPNSLSSSSSRLPRFKATRQGGWYIALKLASYFLNHGDAATKGRAHHHRTTCRVDGLLENCKHQLWWELVITVYSLLLLLEDCNHIKQEQQLYLSGELVMR